MSDAKDRGLFDSNRTSGVWRTRGARDLYLSSFEDGKASQKSISKILASVSVIFSLASPSYMGIIAWDGTPGGSGLLSGFHLDEHLALAPVLHISHIICQVRVGQN